MRTRKIFQHIILENNLSEKICLNPLEPKKGFLNIEKIELK